MYYTDYVARLLAEYATIAFEPGVTEIGPLHNPTILPGRPPWNMDWLIRFPDGKHACLYERWFPLRTSWRSGATMGQRLSFSYHYGTTGSNTRRNGFPARDKTNHPAIIRIDLDKIGPHLHFHGELPHIMQDKVKGMTIEDIDPFAFVRAVLEHRKNPTIDFDSIMQFSVVP
jgi:hypothetical protein